MVISVSGNDFEVIISKESGYIKSYIQKGAEQLLSPVRPNFWRAPIDNDLRGASSRAFAASIRSWKYFTDSLKIKSIEIAPTTSDHAVVTSKMMHPNGSELVMMYHVYPDGTIKVEMSLDPELSTTETLWTRTCSTP